MATIALPSTSPSTKRMALLASFVLFIAVCASAAYWAMQLFKPPARPVAPAPQEKVAAVNTAAAGSLFGGRAGEAAAASNFKLQGLVLASGLAGTSLIMSVDGKPAQSFRADREISPGVTVKEVHPGYVVLMDNGVQKRVELPAELKSVGGDAARNNDPRVAAARPTTPPPRTMPSAANTPTPASAASAPAMQAQQAQQPQPAQGAQPQQQAVPPGTPVPASQAPVVSGASGTAGTMASGAGQQAVVVQSPPSMGAAASQAQPQAQAQGAVVPGQVPQGAVVHGANQQLPGTAPLR